MNKCLKILMDESEVNGIESIKVIDNIKSYCAKVFGINSNAYPYIKWEELISILLKDHYHVALKETDGCVEFIEYDNIPEDY